MDFDQAGSQYSTYSTENNGYKSYEDWAYDTGEWRVKDVDEATSKEVFNFMHNSAFGQFVDFLTGVPSARYQKYQAWLENNQREYEQQNLNDARAYQEYLDSTKYQRMAKDLKAAGLNPWLAVQNGIGNASVNPGSSSYSTSAYKAHNKSDKSSGDKISSVISSAMRLAMLAVTLMS